MFLVNILGSAQFAASASTSFKNTCTKNVGKMLLEISVGHSVSKFCLKQIKTNKTSSTRDVPIVPSHTPAFFKHLQSADELISHTGAKQSFASAHLKGNR